MNPAMNAFRYTCGAMGVLVLMLAQWASAIVLAQKYDSPWPFILFLTGLATGIFFTVWYQEAASKK